MKTLRSTIRLIAMTILGLCLSSGLLYAEDQAAKTRLYGHMPKASQPESGVNSAGQSQLKNNDKLNDLKTIRAALNAIGYAKMSGGKDVLVLEGGGALGSSLFKVDTSKTACPAQHLSLSGGKVVSLSINLGNINTQRFAADKVTKIEQDCPGGYATGCVKYTSTGACERRERVLKYPERCRDKTTEVVPYYLLRIYSGQAAAPNISLEVESSANSFQRKLAHEVVLRFETMAQAKAAEDALLLYNTKLCKQRQYGDQA